MKQTDKLPVERIRLDGGTQSRAQINMAVVAEYAEEMQTGTELPRPTVFHDGQNYWLVDGFHRIYAHKQAFPNKPFLLCNVETGTQQEAIWESLNQNLSHGLRRTNADKRKAVETALTNFPTRSDSEIAKQCGVSQPTVSSTRKELESSYKIYKIEERTVVRNGQAYTQATANIGKAQPKPETKKQSGYPCWTCGEVLDSEQWHCETCDEHWPASVNHCSTCYAAPLLPEEQPEEAAPTITEESPIEPVPTFTDDLRARADAARQAIPMPTQKPIPTGITTQWLDDICKLQMRVAGTKLDTLSEAVTQWADDDLQKGIRECDRFISIFQTWRSVFTSESQSRGIYEQAPKVHLRPVSTITNEFSVKPKPEHLPQSEGEKLLKRGKLLLRQGQKPECDLSKFGWSVIRFRERINDNHHRLSPEIKSELEGLDKGSIEMTPFSTVPTG
jgi:hypothetical protein